MLLAMYLSVFGLTANELHAWEGPIYTFLVCCCKNSSHQNTSDRRLSIETFENAGTTSSLLTRDVMKSLPDSARSQVIHAAKEQNKIQSL